jgi:hypothetical protein
MKTIKLYYPKNYEVVLRGRPTIQQYYEEL